MSHKTSTLMHWLAARAALLAYAPGADWRASVALALFAAERAAWRDYEHARDDDDHAAIWAAS